MTLVPISFYSEKYIKFARNLYDDYVKYISILLQKRSKYVNLLNL